MKMPRWLILEVSCLDFTVFGQDVSSGISYLNKESHSILCTPCYICLVEQVYEGMPL